MKTIQVFISIIPKAVKIEDTVMRVIATMNFLDLRFLSSEMGVCTGSMYISRPGSISEA